MNQIARQQEQVRAMHQARWEDRHNRTQPLDIFMGGMNAALEELGRDFKFAGFRSELGKLRALEALTEKLSMALQFADSDGLAKVKSVLKNEIDKIKPVEYQLAERVLKTFKIKPNGFAELTIPRGYSIKDIILAFNAYYKEECPFMDSDLFRSFDRFSDAKCSTNRNVSICALVEATDGLEASKKIGVVKKKRLVQPENFDEVALIAAANICHTKGQDILGGKRTSTAIKGQVMSFYQERGYYQIFDFSSSDYGLAAVKAAS